MNQIQNQNQNQNYSIEAYFDIKTSLNIIIGSIVRIENHNRIIIFIPEN